MTVKAHWRAYTAGFMNNIGTKKAPEDVQSSGALGTSVAIDGQKMITVTTRFRPWTRSYPLAPGSSGKNRHRNIHADRYWLH